MAGAPVALVTTNNLGSDFDVGAQVANKLNIVAATTTVKGKSRFATQAEAQALTALLALDAASLVAAMGQIMSAWLATLPTTPQTAGSGTWWNNDGTPTKA